MKFTANSRFTSVFSLSLSLTVFLLVSFFISSVPLHGEEGMYPLSEIDKLDLKAAGFEITAGELYNPGGTSLMDGVIKLRGCTASFVSPDGLMLTNYHCAFRAVQAVTTPENDYMRDGFFSKCRDEEVLAKGATVRLIETYKDVSKDVLKAIKKKMSHAKQAKAIEKRKKQIVVAFEKKNPGKRAEVAEMFAGKTYILFVYRYLKDVRLVYAPPRSIGEYGGEIDNWMWPRHTGDFAFLRAYTAPDGSSAEYSPDNVPFHPKRYLKVAPEGVEVEDLVFALGYPGRTHRHKTSHFLAYEQEVRMPYDVELFKWVIDLLEGMSLKNRETAIKLSSPLASLWNAMKRWKGQLKGLNHLHLVKKRQEREEKLQAFIDAVPKRKQKYATVLDEIGEVYNEKRKSANHDLLLKYFTRNVVTLRAAYKAYEASNERCKKDTEREDSYMDRNYDATVKREVQRLRNFYKPADETILKELLMRAAALKGELAIPAVVDIVGDGDAEKAIDAFLKKAYENTRINDAAFYEGLFSKSTKELDTMDDPFMVLARSLYPTYQKQELVDKRRDGKLTGLYARLIEVKKLFEGKEFIPDANSTVRISYGRIRGYSPADAVVMKPFTTLSGVVAKNTGKDPFECPERLIKLVKAKDFGSFMHPKLKDVPVAMLYDMDTTGGNSGSPVLNARGELVGLNFDRVFEATVNDFAWDKNYSRSIGVDIRYILWFLEKYSGAEHLLKEMKVK